MLMPRLEQLHSVRKPSQPTFLTSRYTHPPAQACCAAAHSMHAEAHAACRQPPSALLVGAMRLEVLSVRCASQVANALASFQLRRQRAWVYCLLD